MDELKARGMKGLVLDLRGNPGGLMDTAVKVADLFIDEGPLLHVVPRPDVDEPVTFYATSEGTERDLPLVVMVDQYSASASEIVSGAFKDTGRALVLGCRPSVKVWCSRWFPCAAAML